MSGHVFRGIYTILLVCFCLIQVNQALRCYECLDCVDETCTCEKIVEVDAETSFCALVRENLVDSVQFEIRHKSRNETNYYQSDPYFISVEEIISYNASIDQWLSQVKAIEYACQTDGCNRPDLLKELPSDGLSLNLPSSWLNENLRRKPGLQTSSCRHCPPEPICSGTQYQVDPKVCEVKQCEDICIVDQLIENISVMKYCYELYCLATPIRTPQIYIRGNYYINKRTFEIIENDIICRGSNCSRLEIFKEIEEKLEKNYDNIQAFLPSNRATCLYTSLIVILLLIISEHFIIL
ncbi:unnamed protein product [Adineta ricciae]|uniref:Uncharacterized protein n=1 Tax=Adineta ricciae TaxID=249248 RepID=A0A813V9L3_ADIRI|nr:unnamed protein product [Adineta ricciae]